MTFGLKNAPATFQRMVQEIFNKYLTSFMRVFLDDFSVFGKEDEHIEHLQSVYKNAELLDLATTHTSMFFV